MVKSFIFNIIEKYKIRKAFKSSENNIKWLRSKGVKIGEGCHIWSPSTVTIDITRPSLVDIGNNVYITAHCVILTHGFDWVVLRNKFGEVLGSSGRVKIGDNVFLGIGTKILKGVTIGDNVIIGAGSLVTKDVPSNSVTAGHPAQVICSLEDYFEKRKSAYMNEAFDYATSIIERYNRKPIAEDFWEEFPIFISGDSLRSHSFSERFKSRVKKQLGETFNKYNEAHVAPFDGIDDFLNSYRR